MTGDHTKATWSERRAVLQGQTKGCPSAAGWLPEQSVPLPPHGHGGVLSSS